MTINLNNNEFAINGGSPYRKKPWLDNLTIGEEEKSAVLRVMDSGYLSLFEGSFRPDPPFSFSGGPEVKALENEWSRYYQAKFSIALNSATSGLFAAIGSLEIGYGDEVIVSPYTMTACAIAPLLYGAIPVFADVNKLTGSIDPLSIRKVISTKTKAIIVVHQFGIPAEMDKIMEISREFDIKIIEDCAQAHGAKYNGKYVGTIGDIGVFSLNINKSIQAGEGGVCITNSEEISYRLKLIRNHGEAVVEKANYKNLINLIGFNYRMTEYCAAIAREQLKKLDKLNKIRIELVELLNTGFESLRLLKSIANIYNSDSRNNNNLSTYYLYPIIFNQEDTLINRRELVETLNAEGLCLYEGYSKPLYMQPLYQNKCLFKSGYPFMAKENRDLQQNYSIGTCKIAEDLFYKKMIISEHIRFPHDHNDIKDIINIMKKILT